MTKPAPAYRNVRSHEAAALLHEGGVHVLDVRSPAEYAENGHIPGAILLPIDWIVCGVATLPRDEPLLVHCEHGVRSRRACQVLAQAGFSRLMNLSGGLSQWIGPRERTPGSPFGPYGPCSWLIENAERLPTGGRVLDLACGRGRHALLLATAGFEVDAVDRDAEMIAHLADVAQRLGLPVRASAQDLEVAAPDLGQHRYDAVVVVHYLHRPLFPAIRRALKPGGILIYETFTVEQAARGHPKNPAFLLRCGELVDLVAPLRVVNRREGDFEGRLVSAVVAERERKEDGR